MTRATKAKTTKSGSQTRPGKPVPPFYAQAKRVTPEGDSIAGAFAAATASPDRVAGLRRFLKSYEPADREYQDAFHRNRVRAAQYELMRLEYLSGNVKAGDRLLSQLHDLDD